MPPSPFISTLRLQTMSIPVNKLSWIKDLTKKLVQLEADTSAKQNTIDKMASEENEKLSLSQSKIISLEGKIKAFKHRDKMLNRNIKKRSNSEISEIESLTEKLVKLQGENASKQAQIDSVNKLFSKLEEKIVKLKHNEKALTLYVAKTIEDIESSKNIKINSSSLKSLIAEKEKKISELEFDLENIRSALAISNGKVADTAKRAKRLETELAKTREAAAQAAKSKAEEASHPTPKPSPKRERKGKGGVETVRRPKPCGSQPLLHGGTN